MRDEKKIWEHQVDHNLFSIAKLDLTVRSKVIGKRTSKVFFL